MAIIAPGSSSVQSEACEARQAKPVTLGIDPAVEFGLAGDDHVSRNTPHLDPDSDQRPDDVTEEDREFLAQLSLNWHSIDPMPCGYDDADFDGWGDESEEVVVQRYLRPRAKSMAIDAEEEARAVYGWYR